MLAAILYYPGIEGPLIIDKDKLEFEGREIYRNCMGKAQNMPYLSIHPVHSRDGMLVIP